MRHIWNIHNNISLYLRLLIVTACILPVSSYAAVTQINSLYAYPTTSQVFYHPGNAVTDGTAMLSDAWLGLAINISGAVDQDKWVWEFLRPDGTRVAREQLKYVQSLGGRSRCFVFAWSGSTYCGSNGGPFELAYESKCVALGEWNVRLTYTPADGSAIQVFDNFVDLKSTGPHVSIGVWPNEIKPKVIGGNGIPHSPSENADVAVVVTDSGCKNIPLPDANVEISTLTVPGSGGHTHLGEQSGTGTFENGTTTTSDISDSSGLVKAAYSSGIAGVEERVVAVATVETPDGVLTGQGEGGLVIKIPGLIPVPASDIINLYQSSNGENAHQHNNYATPGMNALLQGVAWRWMQEQIDAGELPENRIVMSYNDMSLPFGGVFDVCGSMQPNCPPHQGHVSHEIGNDVDVNVYNVMDLNATEREYLLMVFEGFGDLRHACRYIHDHHFRCDTVMLEQ
ncbi:MAG: hypothetical protein OEZ16_05655 [Chromatiales bacterium]|nr:hypothetical protein [Chromatiales bacterium]